jgi:hypothetical protein
MADYRTRSMRVARCGHITVMMKRPMTSKFAALASTLARHGDAEA